MSSSPNNPTQTGSAYTVSSTRSVTLSLNEIEMLSFKAARGAGMAWGLAEEAGFAVRWLAGQGLDGAGSLLELLLEQTRQAQTFPDILDGIWQSNHGQILCPIAAGTTLCDFTATPTGFPAIREIKLGSVSHPLLILPFAAVLAERCSETVIVNWSRGRAFYRPHTGFGDGVEQLEGVGLGALTISLGGKVSETFAGKPKRTIAADVLAGLNRFALLTTVPESEASRANAGAGVGDND